MLSFFLPDQGRLSAVRLYQEVGLDTVELSPVQGGWRLEVPRPRVDRMEYLFEVTHRDGRRETILDPGNPLRVAGVFGDKSVLEFPEYRAPSWVRDPAPPYEWARETIVSAPGLDISWYGPAEPPPFPSLLVVHDGPEYARLAMLLRYLELGIRHTWFRPMWVALLQPHDRNRIYAADDDYADALSVLGRIPARRRIGMGTSLGALAMLHAHRRHPDLFDALFLQSGSFFTREHDPQERRFPRFEQITDFVESAKRGKGRPVPVAMTCGLAEENLSNNHLLAEALDLQGYDVTFREVADVHNYTAWRDAFHPHLSRLLQDMT
ncbi:alpha/beta hydrolase [Nonomuraea soli]|uniref:Enterochelin esterase family protein n=1 Tax=Nonomuraea soli TaxID=1032476 RepID=A0A7W0CCV4_9ACTN|nr:esterase [Nonomuraea soli]MBA2888807.1 enterochelin esterase family protein [Nonomuraea soli]